MLRLFNDCFAVGALFIAIYAYQKRIWTLGSIAFSLGIGVKMSLLLALPGVILILGQGSTVNRALRNVAAIVQVQVSFLWKAHWRICLWWMYRINMADNTM